MGSSLNHLLQKDDQLEVKSIKEESKMEVDDRQLTEEFTLTDNWIKS